MALSVSVGVFEGNLLEDTLTLKIKIVGIPSEDFQEVHDRVISALQAAHLNDISLDTDP